MILPRRYIPEIHDVHPGMARALEPMLCLLSEEARRQAVFMVVPDWEGRFALDSHPRFCERLRALPGRKALHGYTHSLGASWWSSLTCGTENHSEFGRLSQAEASRRLAAGAEMFQACLGERPLWFCAPRWNQSSGTRKALEAGGYEGWMDWSGLAPRAKAPVRISALNFDVGRRRAIIAGSRIARRASIRSLLRNPRPFRLAFHPTDVEHPKTWRQIKELMDRLNDGGWRPMSLDEALAPPGGNSK